MTNFRVNFSHPWLLLLLIPAIGLTLLPYFRLAKRYRRTRNRVVSMILHMIVMFLAITMLAGMTFSYELPNKDNQIIILVDSSYSNREAENQKESFVEDLISECGSEFKVGVVKFGYDQVYAAKLSNNPRTVYQDYVQSADPDTSATDIASALKYASSLLADKPKTSKIVLLSDGVETDDSAASVIKAIAAQGIKVDAVYYPNDEKLETLIMGVTTPENNVDVGEEFRVQMKLKTNITGEDQTGTVTVYDNETPAAQANFILQEEEQTIEIPLKFDLPGLHELRFEIEAANDTLTENNVYYSYMYLEVFENILVVEKGEGESSELKAVLEENNYKVTTYSIDQDLESIPQDIDTLCSYEQVILVNIANSDMPAGFDELLHEYVHELGGGLLTVGGENDTNASGDVVPHAYNRDDMFGSLYQEMLPVQVVNYTPPVAVMIVIDSSGSMGTGPMSKLAKAKEGALACLSALTSRDYFGVITFESESNEQLRVTPVSERKQIQETIAALGDEGTGGTVFSYAIEDAGRALSQVDVEKRHIIMVTDGQAADKGKYEEYISANLNKGIHMSVVGIQATDADAAKMNEDANLGGGKFIDAQNLDLVADEIYNLLVSEAIAEIAYGEEFRPTIGDYTSVVAGIKAEQIPVLTGYYGTKLKSDASVVAPLMGKYVPIYAQWKYGAGSVGSFMSDLSGDWSAKFIDDSVGQTIIYNIVDSIFPSKKIQSQEMKVTFNEDNYTTQMNVYTPLEETEKIDVQIKPVSQEAIQYYSEKEIPIAIADSYTRVTFDITHFGIYEITVTKKNELDETITELSFYKTFSYSEEYNVFPEEGAIVGEEFMTNIADSGRGVMVEDVLDVFDSFARTIKKDYDPSRLFAILILILFLLDVAVRKFKFKWPHEIIRDYREKRALNQG